MSAQQILLDKYGPPDAKDYQSLCCVIWQIKQDFQWFPATKFLVNEDFKNMLHSAFHMIEAAGLQSEIKTFDGCFNLRMVRGKPIPSLHSWGAAIDLNASTEKLGQIFTNWTTEFLTIMKSVGIYWGGDFKSRKDPMHFAMLQG